MGSGFSYGPGLPRAGRARITASGPQSPLTRRSRRGIMQLFTCALAAHDYPNIGNSRGALQCPLSVQAPPAIIAGGMRFSPQQHKRACMKHPQQVIGALLAGLCLAPLRAEAQTGTIRGKVTDAAAGPPLSGATVSFGTRRAQTGPDGQFVITGVAAVTDSLRARLIG